MNQTNVKSSPPIVVNLEEENISHKTPHKPNKVPAWKPTPSAVGSGLLKQYMKLSKIRLTSIYDTYYMTR